DEKELLGHVDAVGRIVDQEIGAAAAAVQGERADVVEVVAGGADAEQGEAGASVEGCGRARALDVDGGGGDGRAVHGHLGQMIVADDAGDPENLDGGAGDAVALAIEGLVVDRERARSRAAVDGDIANDAADRPGRAAGGDGVAAAAKVDLDGDRG